MKFTSKAFKHVIDSLLTQNKGFSNLTSVLPNTDQPVFKIDEPLLMPHPTWSLDNTTFYDFTPKIIDAGELHSLMELKIAPLPENNANPVNPITSPTLDRVLSSYVPTSTPPFSVYSPAQPQTWFFSFATRELCNATTCIKLTAIESLLIKTLTLSTERICAKQALILGIDKDPQSYSGLEMCLSRLQSKFRAAYNERLFRSVRNRGYCLVQDIKIIH